MGGADMAEDGWDEAQQRGGPLPLLLGVLALVVVVGLLVRPGQDGAAPEPTDLRIDATPTEGEPSEVAAAEDVPGADATPDDRAVPGDPDVAATPAASPAPHEPSNRWQPMSRAPFEGGIRGPGAWDGRRLILWPGRGSGGVYAPDVDAWASLPPAPIARLQGWTATWTGEEVLYWGGLDGEGEPTADGAALATAGFRWRTMAPAPLRPRTQHAATWGGGRLHVFGGIDAQGRHLADGASYDPATDTWEAIPAAPFAGRALPTLAWFDGDDGRSGRDGDDEAPTTGELIVWGGSDGDEAARAGASLTDGARYDPQTGWRAMAEAPVAMRRGAATAWTGTEECTTTGACGNLHVWGRPAETLSVRDGYTYDAFRDQWDAHPLLLGQTRSDAVGLWTGRIMLVFGGRDQFDRVGRTDGFMFDPNSQRWRQVPKLPRDLGPGPVVAWTGEELLVWGAGQGVRLPIDDTTLR